jgi:hypothetical protein
MYGLVLLASIFSLRNLFFSLKLDSNISEHTHLFDELQTQLSSKFHSIIVKLQTIDQYSSIHNILKTTKIELDKVENFELIFIINKIIIFSFIRKRIMKIRISFFN